MKVRKSSSSGRPLGEIEREANDDQLLSGPVQSWTDNHIESTREIADIEIEARNYGREIAEQTRSGDGAGTRGGYEGDTPSVPSTATFVEDWAIRDVYDADVISAFSETNLTDAPPSSTGEETAWLHLDPSGGNVPPLGLAGPPGRSPGGGGSPGANPPVKPPVPPYNPEPPRRPPSEKGWEKDQALQYFDLGMKTAIVAVFFGAVSALPGSSLLFIPITLATAGLASQLFEHAHQHYLKSREPILIDIDSDGLQLSSGQEAATYFDIDSDGFSEKVSWSTHDAMLVRDLNSDGLINNGLEVSFVGEGVTDIERLSAYDTNSDGVINYSDAIYHELSFWVDANGNGISDSGERVSLEDAGVLAINLNPTPLDPNEGQVVYWYDANADGVVDPDEVFNTAAEAPNGAIAARRIDGGYIFQTTTFVTTSGNLTAYAVGLDYNEEGVKSTIVGDDLVIEYEDGRIERFRLISDEPGEAIDLTGTTYSGAIGVGLTRSSSATRRTRF